MLPLTLLLLTKRTPSARLHSGHRQTNSENWDRSAHRVCVPLPPTVPYRFFGLAAPIEPSRRAELQSKVLPKTDFADAWQRSRGGGDSAFVFCEGDVADVRARSVLRKPIRELYLLG